MLTGELLRREATVAAKLTSALPCGLHTDGAYHKDGREGEAKPTARSREEHKRNVRANITPGKGILGASPRIGSPRLLDAVTLILRHSVASLQRHVFPRARLRHVWL